MQLTDTPWLVVQGQTFFFHYVSTVAAAFDAIRFSRVLLGDQTARCGDPDVVLVDLRFPGQPTGGLGLLRSISHMTADVGTVMLTSFGSLDTAFEAGSAHADRFLGKGDFMGDDVPIDRLLVDIAQVAAMKKAQPELHDRLHKEVVDVFAEKYDEEEQSYPATVAYYMFEDAVILDLVEELGQSAKCVRVLDVGCGTGRIEKLL